jgi:hypothetical protein
LLRLRKHVSFAHALSEHGQMDGGDRFAGNAAQPI